MTEGDFAELVRRIQNVVGCGKELAGDYAMAIGDKPEIQNGKIIVRDEARRIIAHLPEHVMH
jgi:hypothetical protein